MNVKIKITLHAIAKKVSNGIMTAEQAAAHFKKVTGQDLEEFTDSDDKEVGEFLAFLEGAYPPAPVQDLEVESEEDLETDPADSQPDQPTADPEKNDAPAVPVDLPKRTRQTQKEKQ